MPAQLTAAELRHLLVTILAGAAGSDTATWERLTGPITVHSLATHPICNWSVTPAGTAAQRNAIAKAVELVRAEHPLVAR